MSVVELVELRDIDINDEFVNWHTNEHAKNYSASKRKFTKENLLSEYQNGVREKKLYQYLVHHKNDNKNIGVIKIGPIDYIHNKSDLVVFIGDKNYLKKGLGSEAVRLGNQIAFNKLDIRKVHGPIVKSNPGAVKVYTNADWVIEAVLKGHYLVDDKAEDAILVACYNPKDFNKEICENSKIKFEDIYKS